MKKYFGFIYFVIVIIGIVWLFNYLSPTSRKIRMLERVSKEYGGVYVFYPEFREEIKKRERERREEDDKLSAIVNEKARQKMKEEYGFTDEDIQKLNTPQKDYFKQKQYDEVWNKFYRQIYAGFEEKYPQILSNGCKYHNQAFGPYDSLFDSYYEKIKEFIGEKVYKKLKPSLVITSFYRCEDGSEGLITLWTDIGTTRREFGLFGDSGRGFFLSRSVEVNIGGSNTFELIDGKFKKVDKKYEGWR